MLRTDLTTNKASANVTETESSPITILSAEKQAFAALFCKGIVRQVTKQMHNLFAKNGSLHSPEQPMPVLLCGHFAFPQFLATVRNARNNPCFQEKTNRLLIAQTLFNALPVIFRIAEVLSLLLLRKLQLHSITAIRKLKCTNPLKKQPAVNALTKASVRKTLQMPPLFAADVLQCRF